VDVFLGYGKLSGRMCFGVHDSAKGGLSGQALRGTLCTLGRSTGLGSIVSICQDYELKTVVVGHSVDDGVENVPTL